ncbi:MAG: hypothetical protein U0V72_00710 [Cytophagales bacterium]
MRIKQEVINSGGTVSVEYLEISLEDKLNRDKGMGLYIVDQFLLLLKAQNMSVSSSVNLLSKFVNIKMLLEMGAVKEAKVLLYLAETDELFTQEVKQDYINQITSYLAQYED